MINLRHIMHNSPLNILVEFDLCSVFFLTFLPLANAWWDATDIINAISRIIITLDPVMKFFNLMTLVLGKNKSRKWILIIYQPNKSSLSISNSSNTRYWIIDGITMKKSSFTSIWLVWLYGALLSLHWYYVLLLLLLFASHKDWVIRSNDLFSWRPYIFTGTAFLRWIIGLRRTLDKDLIYILH